METESNTMAQSVKITALIQQKVADAVKNLYDLDYQTEKVQLTVTRKEFEGDYTVVVFPFTKAAKKKPEQIGEELGNFLVEQTKEIAAFNVIKGFLNLTIDSTYWRNFLLELAQLDNYGTQASNGKKVMVEFSSPNTNKPLHLGHIRNILLGWSCAQIFEAAGYEVVRTQIINDRGIAVCKSMLAWQKFSKGATPASEQVKSDHFVGSYYVRFEQEFKKEYKVWQASEKGQAVWATKKKDGQTAEAFFKAYKNTYFNEFSVLGAEAKAMLLKWEDNDADVRGLWKKMNDWVYDGFESTYKNMGVWFDKLYYESDTYLLGKEFIAQGLKDNIFYKKEDGSVWIDLEDAKMDHKLVLRSDGTSVYMTQDIGTAILRYQENKMDEMVYVVADEQNYHFKVLFEIMKRLEQPFADGLHHLSYGMVDLPTGKMKSREGTVVDADDLMVEVVEEARKLVAEQGALTEVTPEEKEVILRKVGMAALKFFIVKVNPQKRMIFDPKESVDLHGQTGPYIQYAYVRINGVCIKAAADGLDLSLAGTYKNLESQETDLILLLSQYPEIVQMAAQNYDPSEVANYCYVLAKSYNKFWHDLSIFKAPSPEAVAFRLELSKTVGNVLKSGMDLLGIEMPQRM